jgi:hypothetical protein
MLSSFFCQNLFVKTARAGKKPPDGGITTSSGGFLDRPASRYEQYKSIEILLETAQL